MSDEFPKSNPVVHERPNHDGRVFGENGEPDVFIPGNFWGSLAFFIFSCAMTVFGLWDMWEPSSRFVFGEVSEARVVQILRQSPGEADEVIRIRRVIKEDEFSHSTVFRHYVEVIDADGSPQILQMAVASRRVPYALINETFDVAYFPGGQYAYGILHHRTWAFGLAFTLMGGTLMALSWHILSMVGKPIIIDPEDPEDLQKEREAEERERQRDAKKA